jgi:signal transduction histidine kinase
VKDASEQLLALIGDLLELTALKREVVAATVTEFDPREPLRDALSSAQSHREQVVVEVSQPEIVPLMRSDRRSVTRALKALIDNAFKFTRQGQVRVTLRVAGDRASYCVEDTGIGIPTEAQSFVFDEFRQADGTRTREFKGSGLGLSLARRLARLVHGDITFVSTPGVGSTFTFDLPLRYDDVVTTA